MSEYPKCSTVYHPKARKPHRCCECGGCIKPGEKYERFSGVWDDPATYKTCTDCVVERKRYRESVDSWEAADLCFEQLYENLRDWPRADFVRVMEIRKKRGVEILPWMQERIDKANDWTDDA